MLTSLGNLAGWGLGPGETSFIKQQLALTNTDLQLHDYGADRDEDELIIFALGLEDQDEFDEDED